MVRTATCGKGCHAPRLMLESTSPVVRGPVQPVERRSPEAATSLRHLVEPPRIERFPASRGGMDGEVTVAVVSSGATSTFRRAARPYPGAVNDARATWDVTGVKFGASTT